MNWQDLNKQLSLLLSDLEAGGTPQYPYEFRKAMFNLASDYFAQTHTAPLKSESSAVSLEAGAVIPLPANCMVIAAVENKYAGKFLIPNIFRPGDDSFSDGIIETSEGIQVFCALSNGYRLWYYSFYPHVAEDTDALLHPQFATYALLMLTMALLLNPDMLAEASLSRFDSKRDNGTPEQSAMRKQADWYFRMYEHSLQGIPPQQRSFFNR